MKIGGRIIQNRNIKISTGIEFSATYKQHYIEVSLYKQDKGSNPEWDCVVSSFDGGAACNTIVMRCTIHDAIVYALNSALL